MAREIWTPNRTNGQLALLRRMLNEQASQLCKANKALKTGRSVNRSHSADMDPSPGVGLVFSDSIGPLHQRPDCQGLNSSFVFDVMALTDRGTPPVLPLGCPYLLG